MPLTGEVLIVDDTPENLQVLSAILRATGLHVRMAPHGAFALTAVQARKPDIILLDVRMPGLDGFATCRRLRDDPGTCAIPVLFLSASQDPDERIQAFAAGGVDFISKPFHADEVVARVTTHLTMARLRLELAAANARLAERVHDERRQRLRVEEIAQQRQVRLDLVLSAAGMGIWSTHTDGQGMSLDDDACDILGRSAPLVAGGWDEFVTGFAAHERERLTAIWRSACSQAQAFELEGWWMVAGESRRIRIRGRTAKQDDGLPGMVGLVWNVTREHAVQARLAQSQKLEYLGQMAGGLAHDFNNHLAVIIGNLELLRRTVGGDPLASRRFASIDRAIGTATALVGGLLTFARRREVGMEIIRPAAVVTTLHEMLDSLFGRGIDIVLDVIDTSLAVFASHEQLQNAVLNLCVNARDAMPDGGRLTLGVAYADLDGPQCRICGQEVRGAFAVISVSDTGSGIPAALQERIFEPFFTTKPEGKGTGLGLATVAGCVTTHRGHLLLDTTPGCGSTFRILLPCASAAQDRLAKPDDRACDGMGRRDAV
jgi:signal transduction histidine kinase